VCPYATVELVKENNVKGFNTMYHQGFVYGGKFDSLKAGPESEENFYNQINNMETFRLQDNLDKDENLYYEAFQPIQDDYQGYETEEEEEEEDGEGPSHNHRRNRRSVSSRRRSQGSRIHLDEGGRSQGSRIHLNEGGRSHGSRIHIDEGVCSQGSRIHLDEGVRSQGSGIHPDEGGRSQGSRTYQDDGDFDPFDFPPKRKRKQQKSAFNETAFY